jgi:DEAD/DEAH box helicase domain-containing protein
LLREFIRRPRRANTIETLGFARLRFAAIDDIPNAKIPGSFTDLGGRPQDWRDFLSILLTYLVRANSAVRVDWKDKHWIQPRGGLTEYVPASKENRRPLERAWPSVPQGDRPLGRPTRPVVLLAQGLSLPLDDHEARAAIQEWLDAAMVALTVPLSPPGAVTRQLDFSTAHVAAMTRGFLCPVTQRMLDVTFRGFSPYGAGEVTAEPRTAEAVDLPRHPLPFMGQAQDADPETAREDVAHWLANDPASL